MEMVTRSQAEEDLKPYLPIIMTCIKQGYNDYRNSEIIQPKFEKRTKACALRDCVVHYVKQEFEDLREVRVLEKQGMFSIVISKQNLRYLVRFKKLNHNLRSSNYPTYRQQQMSYQLPIDGWPTGTYLDAGYVMDDLGIGIESSHITCSMAKNILWSICIDDVLELAPVVTLTSPKPVTPPRQKRAKLKVIFKAQEGENDGEGS